MVAVFAGSKKGDGPMLAFPDICLTPAPGESLSLIPYPNGTLISVSKKKSVRKVYSVKSGKARELPIREVRAAPTFIILNDGSVLVHEHECRTPAAAKRAVAGDIGANASAIVISIDEDEKSPLAFRVTPRSVRVLRIEEVSGTQETAETTTSERPPRTPQDRAYAFKSDGKVTAKDLTQRVMEQEGLMDVYSPVVLEAARELASRNKNQGRLSSSDPESPIPKGERMEISVAELKAILEALEPKQLATGGVARTVSGGRRPISGGLDDE